MLQRDDFFVILISRKTNKGRQQAGGEKRTIKYSFIFYEKELL
jgi:hypothetical protein